MKIDMSPFMPHLQRRKYRVKSLKLEQRCSPIPIPHRKCKTVIFRALRSYKFSFTNLQVKHSLADPFYCRFHNLLLVHLHIFHQNCISYFKIVHFYHAEQVLLCVEINPDDKVIIPQFPWHRTVAQSLLKSMRR